MDNHSQSRAGRIDEFTESVEQLWQSEEQQCGESSQVSGGSATDTERGASAP